MVECARISLDIFAQKAFDDYRGAPIFPARLPRNDAELVEFVRAKAETVYHPVGTCRMGSDDAEVVDPQLRGRGIEGLGRSEERRGGTGWVRPGRSGGAAST